MTRHEVTPWGSTPQPTTPADERAAKARMKAHRRSIPKAAVEGQAYTDNFPWSWRRRR